MELRHLRYFVAVAEEEHFGRAAVRLHVSQSPLSRQIAQLAAELGVELFVPAGRGVALTDAGRAFLIGAKATLARVELASTEAREAAQGRIGTVSIGFEGGSAYSGMLPDVVAEFRARHPRVHLQLLPMNSADQWTALRAGDIALGYGYYAPEGDPEIRSRVLFKDPMAVVVPDTHRLASRRTLRVEDVANEGFVWSPRDENPQLYDEIIVAFRAHGATLNIVQEERDGEAILTLVASGAGLTLSVESTADLLRGRAILKRVTDLGVTLQGRSLWRAADEGSPLVRSLLEVTHEVHARGKAPLTARVTGTRRRAAP